MLAHILGLDNGTGAWYLWWSGFGSDITELSLLALPIAYLRHHTCHTDGCWRLGHPDRDGHVLCRRHR